MNITTKKMIYCGGSIAAGAKNAAIGSLLRRFFGPPQYIRSIAAGQLPAAIGLLYCGGAITRRNRPELAAYSLAIAAGQLPAAIDPKLPPSDP